MEIIINDILFTLWFFLPAGLANSSAVLAAKLPFLKKYNYPLDMYKNFRGVRIFGDHKTVRGLITGIFVGIIVVYLQQHLFTWLTNKISIVNYNQINPLIMGVLMGGGALMGDAVKSFFKRRSDLTPGSPWFPFDQIDYILGSSVLSFFYLQLDIKYYLIFLITGVLLHIITNLTAYVIGIKDVPY